MSLRVADHEARSDPVGKPRAVECIELPSRTDSESGSRPVPATINIQSGSEAAPSFDNVVTEVKFNDMRFTQVALVMIRSVQSQLVIPIACSKIKKSWPCNFFICRGFVD